MTNPRPVILLIDDNEGDRLLITDALEAVGFTGSVVHAGTAGHGLDYLLARGEFAGVAPPELVLLDLNLPVIDGHRFLELAKAESRLDGVSFVMFTSSQRAVDRDRSQRLGVVRHLVKPSTWQGYVICARLLRDDCDRLARAG